MKPEEIYKKYGYYILQQKQPEVGSDPAQQIPVRSPHQNQQPAQRQTQQPARRGGCCGKR